MFLFLLVLLILFLFYKFNLYVGNIRYLMYSIFVSFISLPTNGQPYRTSYCTASVQFSVLCKGDVFRCRVLQLFLLYGLFSSCKSSALVPLATTWSPFTSRRKANDFATSCKHCETNSTIVTTRYDCDNTIE